VVKLKVGPGDGHVRRCRPCIQKGREKTDHGEKGEDLWKKRTAHLSNSRAKNIQLTKDKVDNLEGKKAVPGSSSKGLGNRTGGRYGEQEVGKTN